MRDFKKKELFINHCKVENRNVSSLVMLIRNTWK